jgi:Tfp pilus assembly protein FimT
MTVIAEVSERRERITMYVVAAVAVVALMVVALVFYSSAQATQAAEAKASQLVTALQQAGVSSPPTQEQVVRVLGNDGGATCADPGAALTKAALLSQLANGSGGPGARPVIADRRVVLGQLLIVRIYCPDQLPGFQRVVSGLRFASVAGG